MARTTPGVTRQRLLDEAIHLFATQGYAATSVADIQAACGLTTGSGALYKHFSSKQALLEQAVRQHSETITNRSRDALTPRTEESADQALHRLATTVWEVIDSHHELIRIMLRDYDVFPELFERMWQDTVDSLYRTGAAWLRDQQERGTIEVDDPDATSAVLLASLTYHPLLHTLIGHTPGDTARERFLAAWLDHAAHTLQPRE